MARINAEGLFVLHILFLTFGLIAVVILKHFNFDSYNASPDLNETQLTFIWASFMVALCFLLYLIASGSGKSTPQYASRGAFAIVLMVLGVVGIFGCLAKDVIFGQEVSVGGLRQLLMIFSVIIICAGVLTYTSMKFTEDVQMRWFKDAVKGEIGKLKRAKYVIRKPRRIKQVKRKKAPVRKPKRASSSVAISWEDVPSSDLTDCPGCGKSLRIPSAKRPVKIRCPNCGDEQVIVD